MLKKLTDRFASATIQGRDVRQLSGPRKTLGEAFAPPVKIPPGLSLTAVRPPHQMALLQPGYRPPPVPIDSAYAQPPAESGIRADIYNIINPVAWALDPIDRGDVQGLIEALSHWINAFERGEFCLESLYDVSRRLDETCYKWRVECLVWAMRSVCIDKLKYNLALAPHREAAKAIDAELSCAQTYSSLWHGSSIDLMALSQCMDCLEVTVFSRWNSRMSSFGEQLSQADLRTCAMQLAQSQHEVDAIVLQVQRQLRDAIVSALSKVSTVLSLTNREAATDKTAMTDEQKAIASLLNARRATIQQTVATEVQKAIALWFCAASTQARASFCDDVLFQLRVFTAADLLDHFHTTCASMLAWLSRHPLVRAAAFAQRDNEVLCKHLVGLASTYRLCVQECFVKVGAMPSLHLAVQSGHEALAKMVTLANQAVQSVSLRATARRLDAHVWEKQALDLVELTLFDGAAGCRYVNQQVRVALRHLQDNLDLSTYKVQVVELHARFAQIAMARLYESGLYAVLDLMAASPGLADRALSVAECLLELAAVRSEQGLLYGAFVDACHSAAWKLANRDVVGAIALFKRGLTYPLGFDTAADRLKARQRLALSITRAVDKNTTDWSYTTRSMLRTFAAQLPSL